MAERRTADRRKLASQNRVDVTRGEFKQMLALVHELVEKVIRLERLHDTTKFRLDELIQNWDRRKIPRSS